MENLKLKSIFIILPNQIPKIKDPSENDIIDAKIIYYYPNNENIHIKRSNAGVIEGSIYFLSNFCEDNKDFIMCELNNSYFIASLFENNKYIVMHLRKTNLYENSWLGFTFNFNQNILKQLFKKLITNFYETLVLFHGSLENFFLIKSNKSDIRNDIEKYYLMNYVLNDFIENYFESIKEEKISLFTYISYAPISQVCYSEIFHKINRLGEKIPDIKYISLMYNGSLIHNELPLETISILFNSFFSNIDSRIKHYCFTKPPMKIYSIASSEKNENFNQKQSNYRKSFEILGKTGFLTGISKLNINNYQYFIPEIYLIKTDEKLKLIVFIHSGLTFFILLKHTFDLKNRLLDVLRLEKYVAKYFDDILETLENLEKHKNENIEEENFLYINNSNKSLKISPFLLNKEGYGLNQKEFNGVSFSLKNEITNNGSSICLYRDKLYYLTKSLQRIVILILNDDEFDNEVFEDIKDAIFSKFIIL